MNDNFFIEKAINLALENVKSGQGGPFGAIVVKNGEIIATGTNSVTTNNDPTAHAEVNAIRNACKNLNSYQLDGCVIYSSCEPCPMCLGAIYWSRPQRLVFAASKQDAADAGFDDSYIYDEIKIEANQRHLKTIEINSSNKLKPFIFWTSSQAKIDY